MKLYRWLISLFKKNPEPEWWQIPDKFNGCGWPWKDLNERYGKPGTPLGDTPIQKQDKMEGSVRILPRWYKEEGYVQPNHEDKF